MSFKHEQLLDLYHGWSRVSNMEYSLQCASLNIVFS